MNTLTTAERRALARVSTQNGAILIIAADQRNGMKAAMKDAEGGPDSISKDALAEAKADLVRHLANEAPAVLLDAEVALPRIVDEGTLARNTGLVVGMDASGYEEIDGLRYTRLVPGVTPRLVRDLGGDAAKMLYYVRPDRQDGRSRLAGQIRELVAACTAEGVLLIVELLTYQLPGETDEQYSQAFGTLVADGAALAVECGAKVLKLQYPGSAEACLAVNQAARGVPWAVLSAGVDHDRFVEQVRIAVANGAAGAMCGRALWKDCLSVFTQVRSARLASVAVPRLAELRAAVDPGAAK